MILWTASIRAVAEASVSCKQLLAERMGMNPSSGQANAMMLRIADDPKFAHRGTSPLW